MIAQRRGFTLIELLTAISISVILCLLAADIATYLFVETQEASQLLCNLSLAQELAGRFRADVRAARKISITNEGAEVEFDLGEEKIRYAVRDGMLERHSSTGDFNLGPRVTRVQFANGPSSTAGTLLEARWWCTGSLARPEQSRISDQEKKAIEAEQLATGKSRVWMLALDTLICVEQKP